MSTRGNIGFGETIRALRLGYHWTGTCLMRISDGTDCWRIDIRPAGLVPNNDRLKGSYRVWWEGDGYTWMVKNFAAARIRPKQPFTLYVDDSGQVIGK